MLSRCVSRVLLFIASFVARRLGWPLERYFSFNTGWPLLQLGLTGEVTYWLLLGWDHVYPSVALCLIGKIIRV